MRVPTGGAAMPVGRRSSTAADPSWMTKRRPVASSSVAWRRVLLTGASGGVGHYVTELAASSGAERNIHAFRIPGNRLRAIPVTGAAVDAFFAVERRNAARTRSDGLAGA